jgi:hypothetical protein
MILQPLVGLIQVSKLVFIFLLHQPVANNQVKISDLEVVIGEFVKEYLGLVG